MNHEFLLIMKQSVMKWSVTSLKHMTTWNSHLGNAKTKPTCGNKDWGLKKYTKLNTIFSNKKLRNCVYSFTCMLPNHMGNNIFKDFLKNSLFENMTAGFLLTCQKSLRREISLICHWNIDSLKQKLSFVYGMVPKNDQNII